MKKLFIALGLFVLLGASNLSAQLPACSNKQVLSAKINAIEAQGWVEVSQSFQPVLYLIPPTPPYLAGRLCVSFAPDCDPLEPCPRILRVVCYDIVVLNNNGTCQYQVVQ